MQHVLNSIIIYINILNVTSYIASYIVTIICFKRSVASRDFDSNASSVQFSPGEVRNCYNQTIIDNTSPEYFEVFELVILLNDQIIIGNQSLSRITIIDDDIKGKIILYLYVITYFVFTCNYI